VPSPAPREPREPFGAGGLRRLSRRRRGAVTLAADDLARGGVDPAPRRARRRAALPPGAAREHGGRALPGERGRRRTGLPAGVVARAGGPDGRWARAAAVALAADPDRASPAPGGPPPREGPRRLPARRRAVVAARRAARPGRRLRLQLRRAPDRRRESARRRHAGVHGAPEPWPRRLRHDRGGRPLRLSGPEPREPHMVGTPHGADPARRDLVEQVRDRLRAARRAGRDAGGGYESLPRGRAGADGGLHGDPAPRARGDRDPRHRVLLRLLSLRLAEPGADRGHL